MVQISSVSSESKFPFVESSKIILEVFKWPKENRSMDVLKIMGELFIPHPWLAIFPALALGMFSFLSKSRLVLFGATLPWLLYSLYECLMKARVFCSGECNIRIDLFLIYPVLLLVTATGFVIGLVGFIQRVRPARQVPL